MAKSAMQMRTKTRAVWTPLHDLSLGLVVSILVLLVVLLMASASWGQARQIAGDEPHSLATNYWGMVRPEAEELAAIGFAGSGLGAAAFINAKRTPRPHGPMWHMADVEGGYVSIRSTTPPLKCGCFTADGGNGSLVYHLTDYFGVASDGARVSERAAGSPQGLNLTTYMAGPQVSALLLGHVLPFGHFLVGKAQVDGGTSLAANPGPGSPASTFADAWGGGLDLVVTRDTSVRLAEIDEERTHFHSTLGPRQSNVRLVFGVVFHFKTPAFGGFSR